MQLYQFAIFQREMFKYLAVLLDQKEAPKFFYLIRHANNQRHWHYKAKLRQVSPSDHRANNWRSMFEILRWNFCEIFWLVSSLLFFFNHILNNVFQPFVDTDYIWILETHFVLLGVLFFTLYHLKNKILCHMLMWWKKYKW